MKRLMNLIFCSFLPCKNDITRLEYPFRTNCTRSWSQTPYKVDTDAAYSLAVREA